MEPKTVSKKLLARLPVYLAYLKTLPAETVNISATKLAKALDLGDVLVRKDLAKVSSGGRRKLGYIRADLIRDIEKFLDVNRTTGAIIVGTGKLGLALLDYVGFERSGIQVLAGFDIQPVAQKTADGKPILSMKRLEAFCRCHEVDIGIITVPDDQAQFVCDLLVGCGIHAIWNFAPAPLKVPANVTVQSENLASSLNLLRMQMRERELQH